MNKKVLINSLVFGGMATCIAVPPIVIAATTVPTSQKVYNSAMNYFYDICKIPHCSNEEGHMDSLNEIKQYIIKKASNHLGKKAVHTDKVGNVWADIPASEGWGKCKKLVLQGHMDMVWAATGEAAQWDKWTHPISQPVIEMVDGVKTIHSKDWLTNLGLDNGVAIALMLSLIANRDEFKHGRIRCIFTANEENDAPGSEHLGEMEDGTKVNVLPHEKGYDYLMNLDTGPIGDVVFNSAGGCFNTMSGSISSTPPLTSQTVYTLRIFGAMGGHSGGDIGKGYSNPIGLANQALSKINTNSDIQLISFDAPGSTSTSIPTEAIVSFICPTYASKEAIDEIINPFLEKQKRQKYAHDVNLQWETSQVATDAIVLPTTTSKTIIDFVSQLEFGALERYIEPDEYDAVRVSGNIGTMSIKNDLVQCNISLLYGNRFQEKAYYDEIYKTDIVNQCKAFAQSIGINQKDEEWGSWEGFKDGKMCSLATRAYRSCGIKPRKVRCHGGLECADFLAYNEHLDVVSTGPTILMEHNVKESMALSTYKKLVKMVLWTAYNMKY